ncbi:MAG TPA: PorP/SprF family type IX secretion system membrane protein [Ferruginibacter sp.]|nr:PorP/SprF family type IX secretion system membrane protein [Ferruginibacter sp.]HMP19716.1 PorP/SprF family type IX secretion system membrane protein [Ferruginibacter sp.]
MRYCILFFLLALQGSAHAQDALFSQYYNTPLYMNPGLTGCGKSNMRLTAAGKMQWMNLNQPFKYFTGAADISFFDDYLRNICNLGAIVNHSRRGALQNTSLSGIVGRSFGTSGESCSNWFLSIALQAGYNFSNVGTNYLLFADQLDQNGITGNPSQVDLFNNGNTARNYFDMSSGFVFTFGDFMLGGAVHHLNTPEISFKGASANSKMPRKVTGHLSWVYDNGDLKIKPTVIGLAQGQSKALIGGMLFDFNDFPIELGLWYRNNMGLAYNNAFTIGFNWKFGNTRIVNTNRNDYLSKLGISYDAEARKPGIGTTHGSMEMGYQKNIIINNDFKCPTATSGQCGYRFPWEFF